MTATKRMSWHVVSSLNIKGVLSKTCSRCFPLHPQSRASEDDHPHEDVDHRRCHRPRNELLHSATNGDLGDEHANEGAPGDPPAPVEDGPNIHPGSWSITALNSIWKMLTPVLCSVTGTQLFKGIAVKAKLEDVLEVVAHGLDVEVEEEDGLVHEEDDEHQGQATAEAELRDSPNSIFHPWMTNTVG